jgi:hypothetical protein
MNQILVYQDRCLVGFIAPDINRGNLFYGNNLTLAFIHGLSKVEALDKLRLNGYQFRTAESLAN